jgi:hypothetical protein
MHGLISYLSFTRLLVSLSEYKKKERGGVMISRIEILGAEVR